jgi:hypothetical protein
MASTNVGLNVVGDSQRTGMRFRATERSDAVTI